MPARAAITRSMRAGSATRRASGREAARGHRLDQAAEDRCSTPMPASTAAGSPARVCNTCYNALDRHVDARARRADGAHLRSPGHRTRSARSPTPSCWPRSQALAAHPARLRRRQGRPRHHLHADGAGGGDRHAGLRAHRRDPFGGVRRLRRARSWPRASTTPSRRLILSASLRHRARPHRQLQAAARRGDRARRAQAAAPASILQRPQAEAALIAGPRPRLGERRRATPSARGTQGRTACRSPATDPLYILYTSGTTGQPEGRGARQRRPHGRAQMVDEEPLRRRARRGVLGGLRRRLGGRPLLHRLRAAAARLHHDPVRGQAGRHARRRRVLARDRRARRGRAVHRADRVPRHQEGGPAGRAASRNTTCRNSARCSWPASAPTPTPSSGPRSMLERAGDRSLVADRDRLGDRRQSGRPRAAAGQARLADGADAGLRRAGASTRRGKPVAGRHDGLDRRQAAAAAGLPADAVAAATSASARATSPSSPATTRPPTPASWTRTAISTSWAAPTTSSTSPAIGSRPAAWRRCWPRTRTSPNAP